MMKKILTLAVIAVFLYACSGGGEQKAAEPAATTSASDLMKDDHADRDMKRGVGKFSHVEVAAALNEKMAADGKGVYDLKCAACHRLNNEKLVGPGWEGVTTRRTPEWIMNFATNTDEMLNKDAEAQALLEVCMVRMPNQNLSDEDARNVYEFMRKNDGVK
jgi:cytochrome c2